MKRLSYQTFTKVANEITPTSSTNYKKLESVTKREDSWKRSLLNNLITIQSIGLSIYLWRGIESLHRECFSGNCFFKETTSIRYTTRRSAFEHKFNEPLEAAKGCNCNFLSSTDPFFIDFDLDVAVFQGFALRVIKRKLNAILDLRHTQKSSASRRYIARDS